MSRRAVRSAAIAAALAGAGAPPAAVIEVAGTVVGLAEELLPIGNRNVVTDVAAAAEAARAAATTARVNVEINLARSIAKAAEKIGISCDIVDLGAGATVAAVRETLVALSVDEAVHGIVLLTPLPAGAAPQDLACAIAPGKDVDGASPVSLGRLVAGLPTFAPATAEAVVGILDHHRVGDVDAAAVAEQAMALTPVPGGVGPVTTALLLQHTVQAAAR
ncbi:MAG: cyclodeaminase/cyclohydrolase family protein [Pseudonocardiaceae bacterium]